MTILGIDIGTTSVKVTIIDDGLTKLFSSSQPTRAYTMSKDATHREQSVSAIFKAIEHLLCDVKPDLLDSIKHVSICCQMHGVVFWKSPTSRRDLKMESSLLVTWEDRRCDADFIDDLPKSSTDQNVSSGFGNATIFWFAKHRPEFLEQWDCAGTIGDYLVAYLCGLSQPVMSLQNANSWGYVDIAKEEWELDILRSAGFPVRLLPRLVSSGAEVGRVGASRFSLPETALVHSALGDLQASVFPCLHADAETAVVNIGTSAQLVLPVSGPLPVGPGLAVWPFFRGRRIAVVASLNGGNVLAAFVRAARDWTGELGLDAPTEAEVWARLTAAQAAADGPTVTATLFGERHLPPDRCGATVAGLRPGPGLSLASLFAAVCRGVMDNLLALSGDSTLDSVERVVAAGDSFRRNQCLHDAFLRAFARWAPRLLPEDLDASFGAAMAVWDAFRR